MQAKNLEAIKKTCRKKTNMRKNKIKIRRFKTGSYEVTCKPVETIEDEEELMEALDKNKRPRFSNIFKTK